MAGIGEKYRFQLASSLGIISCRADFNSFRHYHHKHGPNLDGEKRQGFVQCYNPLNLVSGRDPYQMTVNIIAMTASTGMFFVRLPPVDKDAGHIGNNLPSPKHPCRVRISQHSLRKPF